jgi:hypothetical protein
MLSLASDGAASLSATGHDDLWHLNFWEPSSSELYSVSVNSLGTEVTHGPYPLTCTSGLDPLDSAILVPDAVRRLGETGQVPLLMRRLWPVAPRTRKRVTSDTWQRPNRGSTRSCSTMR